MADWLSSMQQTFEYYIVDPNTWRDAKRIYTITSCTIDRDKNADTLGSARIEATESLGECYVRVYLITIQNGVTEKHPLGTFLVQTPSGSFDGKITKSSMDAYTPLIELKENPTPLGYSLSKGMNIMDMAYQLVREEARAPVVKTICDSTLYSDFVSNADDTWITFLADLIANAKYEFALDEMGRILFSPKQETASLQPVWTYDDSNSSILYPKVSYDRDLYGIPNVVEIIYSTSNDYYYARAVNNDPNSPTSTVNRGREILYRDTRPSLSGDSTEKQIQEYENGPLQVIRTGKGELNSALRPMLDGKVSVLTGQSGAGKSTLINELEPSFHLATQEISKALGRGRHTTRHNELHQVCGGLVADTPGFSSLDFSSMEADEVGACIPDFAPYLGQCRFNDCIHQNEPGCAVKQAVEEGKVPLRRYHSYLAVLAMIQERRKKYL